MKNSKKPKEATIESKLKATNYPASEDIYNKNKEEKELNPEDISKKKSNKISIGKMNEKSFEDVKTGVDLDVPGAELDDVQENIGSEDEENNYYSQADTK
ncbi:hypothetical protein FIA58_018945 [Flavobacterium jejuense]|uniref:DUF4025 domain-containing protein n=1 Tax=Flavobacterium jejuense TaxID=1544455 RepID=A0ABX0IYF1_9FLAO|nr:hypothetical protein [Flavobacterium jejuense]NHN27762.1 hypothetical protein [Flavobacterium jejuense]